MDNAWSSLGGGPSDLTFPEQFLGTWKVQNTLVKVETPLGLDFVPDKKVTVATFCSCLTGAPPAHALLLADAPFCLPVNKPYDACAMVTHDCMITQLHVPARSHNWHHAAANADLLLGWNLVMAEL